MNEYDIIMNQKTPIQVFDSWAQSGKDKGMEENHHIPVNEMLQSLTRDINKDFSFIDAGCGNGWVIRTILKNSYCRKAIGVDGSKYMIDNAKLIDPDGKYICADLLEWKPNQLVDFVHSMEVLYYFKKPGRLLQHIRDTWLKESGKIIIGIDFYDENTQSHVWPERLNTHMTLCSIEEWNSIFEDSGYFNIKINQINAQDDFPGTLVIAADAH